jgi:hypothetical protein
MFGGCVLGHTEGRSLGIMPCWDDVVGCMLCIIPFEWTCSIVSVRAFIEAMRWRFSCECQGNCSATRSTKLSCNFSYV